MNQLWTPDQAIEYLGLDKQGLRQPREALRWLCRTGRLRYTKVGRYVRFRREWVEEMIDKNAIAPGTENKCPDRDMDDAVHDRVFNSEMVM